ncbi:hypothetical protein QTN25_009993 [Entamoeba marina]
MSDDGFGKNSVLGKDFGSKYQDSDPAQPTLNSNEPSHEFSVNSKERHSPQPKTTPPVKETFDDEFEGDFSDKSGNIEIKETYGDEFEGDFGDESGNIEIKETYDDDFEGGFGGESGNNEIKETYDDDFSGEVVGFPVDGASPTKKSIHETSPPSKHRPAKSRIQTIKIIPSSPKSQHRSRIKTFSMVNSQNNQNTTLQKISQKGELVETVDSVNSVIDQITEYIDNDVFGDGLESHKILGYLYNLQDSVLNNPVPPNLRAIVWSILLQRRPLNVDFYIQYLRQENTPIPSDISDIVNYRITQAVKSYLQKVKKITDVPYISEIVKVFQSVGGELLSFHLTIAALSHRSKNIKDTYKDILFFIMYALDNQLATTLKPHLHIFEKDVLGLYSTTKTDIVKLWDYFFARGLIHVFFFTVARIMKKREVLLKPNIDFKQIFDQDDITDVNSLISLANAIYFQTPVGLKQIIYDI